MIDEKIPLYSIFVLILILSGGYVIQLIPCKLQKVLESNIYIKHLFAFLTLLFLVTLVDPFDKDNNNIKIVIYRSIILYLFFIFIIKTNYKFFIAIIVLLAFKYLMLLYKNQLLDENNKEKDKIEEKNKNDKDNKDIKDINNNKKIIDNTKKLANITIIENTSFSILCILILIGFLSYYGEKKKEYGNKFNIFTFIFGKPNCRYTPEKIHFLESLKHVFK